MEAENRCERVVILGAGFGGLTTAVRLAKLRGKKAACEIVVVDKCTHHLYRPWLYEVATGDGPEEDLKQGVATPYEDLRTHLSGLGARVEYAEIAGVDWAMKAVLLSDDREIPFDQLVVAVGAVPDFYGIEGLEAHAVPMYSLRDGLRANRRLRELVAMKKRGEIPFVRVVVGGAGPTGVEFACEAAMFMRTQVRKGMIGAQEYSIELVEAASRPLASFHPVMSGWARKRLEKLGIKLLLDTCIKGAHKDHVVLVPRPLKEGENPDMLICDIRPGSQKEVTTDLLVWCGGFRANPVAMKLGLSLDARGRIEVDETLGVRGKPDAWAIGDCAMLIDPATKRPVPQLAQGAIHQGEVVAENLMRRLRGEPLEKYHFPRMHAVVPMGGAWGIAEVFGARFRGMIVWPLRLAADVRYFVKTLPWPSAWKLIRAPLTSFRRNNR